MSATTPDVLLLDHDGNFFRMPRSVADAHRIDKDAVAAIVARAQEADLSKLPADLRAEWKETLAKQGDVEGQDALIGMLIAVKLAFVAIRIGIAMSND